MGTYVEKFYTFDVDGVSTELLEVYEQPIQWHLAHKFVGSFSIHCDGLLHFLEPLAERLHRLKCKDDCGTMYTYESDTDYVSGTVTSCVWPGLCALMDLYTFDLGQRDRRVIRSAIQ